MKSNPTGAIVVALAVLAWPGATFAQQDGTHNLVSKEDAKHLE